VASDIIELSDSPTGANDTGFCAFVEQYYSLYTGGIK
jgi:hypothetical protein